jgi:hypothetical protein
VLSGDRDHRLECETAETAPLCRPGNRDQERTEDARAAFLEAALDRPVDARGKVVDGSVPANRDRARPRDGLVPIDEVELELRQLFGEPAPVDVEDVAVVVVLGQDVLNGKPCGLEELGPFGDGGDAQGCRS